MFRFVMPKVAKVEDAVNEINCQMNQFLRLEALQDILKLLGKDISEKGFSADAGSAKEIEEFLSGFDARRGGAERQAIQDANQNLRRQLYSLFDELGMLHGMSTTVLDKPEHILILGAGNDACLTRTMGASRMLHTAPDTVKEIAALSCYRIVNPVEKKEFLSQRDTEFGVMAEAMEQVFKLSYHSDNFASALNMNTVACVREYEYDKDVRFRCFAAPSRRTDYRADSYDTYDYYFNYLKEHEPEARNDSFLLITNSVYRQYQFISFAKYMLERDMLIDFDIVGCVPENEIAQSDEINTTRYINDLLSIIKWINIFRRDFNLK